MLPTSKNYLIKKVMVQRNLLMLIVVLCFIHKASAQTPAKTPIPVQVPGQTTDKGVAPVPVIEKPPVVEKISISDAKEIRYRAKTTIDLLQRLLNYISFSDGSQSEIDQVISDSYTPASRNYILESKDIIVEDDIDPEGSLANKKEVPVSKYLNDLDVQYLKTSDASISFSNYAYSNIKKKDYVYVRVKFDTKFGSTNKIKKTGYPVRQREVLLKMVSAGNSKWKSTIIGINFFDPANPIESTDNDLQIAIDTSANSVGILQNEIEAQLRKEEQERAKIIAQNEARAAQYVTEGKNYTAAEQYDQALTMFNNAKDLMPLDPLLDKIITDTKKSIADNTYDNFKGKGDQANTERRFDDAIKYYNKAIILDPKKAPVLQPQITLIQKKLKDIHYILNLLQSGQFEAAQKECKRILDLKENRSPERKNDLPEIYYLLGRAYQEQYENKVSDTRSRDRAIENYDLAINAFPSYIDAHIARAKLLVKSKSDYVGAFTDYDALISNALDNNPQKPLYFVQKAQWEDLANRPTAAVDDYTQAIKLNDKSDSIYYTRGELLSRLNKLDDAQKDFDKTIELNAKYNMAWYKRGLNFVTLKDNYKAGQDFIEVEKLKMSPEQQQTVDSISNQFFFHGQSLLANHDFANADSAYDNALKIRNCNAKAFHGKAEIRLLTADEQSAKYQPALAKQSYEESIEFNKKAIKCSPAFSDAHFKEGLAQRCINEYDLAISCFSEAVNSDNSNVPAFIERGNTLQLQKKYLKATNDYNLALALLKTNYDAAKNSSDKDVIKSDQSKAYQLLGQANYYANGYTDALAALNQALTLNGDNAEALYYRGLVYYATNEMSRSIKDYDHAIKVQPQYKYYYADGNSNLKDKNYDVAISHFSGAIRLDTANIIKNKNYLRGLCYFKKKSMNDALNDFNEYSKSEVSKTDTAFFADYGQVQLFANQDSAAYKSFNRTVNLSPNNSKALYGLACFYAKSKQFDKVLDLAEKAFKMQNLKREDIKLEEDTFLVDFNKDKANRNKYKALKQTYQIN
jgi:tetratricopeptide (TPR) repeat protein